MELHISMIPSPEDPPWRSDDYQSSLRGLELAFRADGLDIHESERSSVIAECGTAMSGEWMIRLDAMPHSVLEAVVGSWLQARRGRAVCLTIGEIEADVLTVAEFIDAIKCARLYQEMSESDS